MTWTVPFLDLKVTDSNERQALLKAVDSVLQHGWLVMGPEVQALEEQVAARCQRKYAVGISSGTDALYLALRAAEIGQGDEVITTSLSWIATANAIALTGATPIFADIGDDLNIDPTSVRRLVSSKTKAILPVHYTGKICQMFALTQVAEEYRLIIIEDAAQAFDARYHKRKAGSFGLLGTFSMNPMKVFAACGEAGIVVTDSEYLYERLIALRYNGTINRESCIEPSFNGRIDTVQAAILLHRLTGVEQVITRRREIAGWYDELLAGVVDIPTQAAGEWDVYYTYTIRADDRDQLKAFLETKGIETKIQHPILMPDQPAYKNQVRGEFSHARRLLQRILCLPANEKLTRAQIVYVAECIRAFYGERA